MVDEERGRLNMYFFVAAGITEGYVAYTYIFMYQKTYYVWQMIISNSMKDDWELLLFVRLYWEYWCWKFSPIRLYVVNHICIEIMHSKEDHFWWSFFQGQPVDDQADDVHKNLKSFHFLSPT